MFFRLFIYLLVFVFSSSMIAQDKPVEIDIHNFNIHVVPNSLLSEITINLENASMEAALNEISKKGAIDLNYSIDVLPVESKVTLHVENVNTIEALLMVLRQTSAKLQITKDGSIVILPREKDEAFGKIKGVVIDANSGDPLIGANIMIDGTSIGTATNLDGEFVLPSIEPGNYLLKISYVGYKGKSEKVTVISNRATEVNVKLEWIAVKGKEVIVTAQARGQLSAINEQLSANEIKNVVSKDKIRELPDQNAAESVGRLPGVSLLREDGEGSKVVIRGLSPKYNKIMVDGVTLAPTDDSERSVSMGMISSYSLEGIEVIKSPTANMDGDQVGGSVNFLMKTAPENLNYEVVAQGGYNFLRKNAGDYSFVGNISNRFFNNKLGLFAQFTTDNKDMSSNRMFANYSAHQNTQDEIDKLDLEGVYLANIFKERKRYGGTFTLDYLIPDGKIHFKNFFNSSNSNSQIYKEGYSKALSFSTGDVTSNKLIYSNILSYEQYLSIFKIKAKLAHSFSSTDKPNSLEFKFLNAQGMNSYEPDISPEELPKYLKGSIDDLLWNELTDKTSYNEGRQIAATLDFETDFSFSNQINGKIKFGGKFKYESRLNEIDSYYGKPTIPASKAYIHELVNISRFSDVAPNEYSMHYSRFYDHNFSHGEFMNGKYNLGPVTDIELMHQINDIFRQKYIADGREYAKSYSHMEKTSIIDDYTGIERLGAGYLMAEINISKYVKFIPGVRYEAKKTRYSGVTGNSSQGQDAEREYTYKDTTTYRSNAFLLPMIQLRVEPISWLQIRAAYTHTLARPNYNYYLPNFDIGKQKISMHNPDLKPEQAKSLDLYLAFNQNHIGLFTIGGFYKEIKDKIFAIGERVLLNPEEYNLDIIYKRFPYTTHENNDALSLIRGLEFDWQTNFWYLPSFLKGFVLNVNYTIISSSTKYPKYEIGEKDNPIYRKPGYEDHPDYKKSKLAFTIDRSIIDRLQDQPSEILNLGIGYDYKDFGLRISMNYSDDIFVQESPIPEQRVITAGYTRWDLSATQKLPWYGLQVYCNLVNINGAIKANNHPYDTRPRNLDSYGTSAIFGIKWRNSN